MGPEELAALQEVLTSGWITTGPKNRALEEAFCTLTGNRHAIAVSSATAGMHVTLMALGIGPGDEVITPSLTRVSTLNMIVLLGATPVMIDVDRDTLMVTPQAVEAAITPRTKAIVPVHYAGAPCDIDGIRAIAERHGIPVVEDAAHAAGTYYKSQHVGHQGTAIFSFHAIKNMTCAEGGLVVTDDEQLAQSIRSLKFHGLGVDAYDRQTHGRAPQAEVITPASNTTRRISTPRWRWCSWASSGRLTGVAATLPTATCMNSLIRPSSRCAFRRGRTCMRGTCLSFAWMKRAVGYPAMA